MFIYFLDYNYIRGGCNNVIYKQYVTIYCRINCTINRRLTFISLFLKSINVPIPIGIICLAFPQPFLSARFMRGKIIAKPNFLLSDSAARDIFYNFFPFIQRSFKTAKKWLTFSQISLERNLKFMETFNLELFIFICLDIVQCTYK